MLFGALLFPTTPDAAHAEETTKATLAIQPTLAVTLPNTVNFEVQPTAAGAVTSGSATLSISTNNETGYSLYLSTADDDNALHSINPDTQQTITALTQENTTAINFTNNTWGYNLSKDTATDSTTYQSVPTTQPSDPQITTEAPTTDNYNLTFAAKVDSSLPSGTYTNTVTVSVVTNPAYLPPFEGIETMQEMTSAICSNADEGETARLKDARDDKLYWVAKLADGNCWMTQNLRLAGGQTLTSEDSNVASNWDFPDNSLTLGNSFTEARSALSDNSDPATTLEHGGYYNYCAASAGTVCSQTQANAFQDICPKGWRLPTNSEQGDITGYASAFSPVLSGYYYNGSLGGTGSGGSWWSSTAYDSNYQYYLSYSGGSLYTSNYGYKGNGYSVRCIRSNPGTLTISFNGNGSTGGSTASQQIAAGSTAPMNANGFTRNGYAFTGWNTAADGSGTSYADGADYTVTPATGDATVTLYAQWEELVNVGYIQDFTNAQCQAQASSRPVIATDIRDNNAYTLRYINGACWMTTNLRVASGTQLTSADSNLPDGTEYTIPTADLTLGDSYTEGRVHAGEAHGDNSALDTGYWYNYCAASAGQVCSQTQMDATQDICPKGWRLPTRTEQSSITGRTYRSAFAPVAGGNYRTGKLSGIGDGSWWSSTASGSNSQYNLFYYGNGSTLSIASRNKYLGYYVRCVRSS